MVEDLVKSMVDMNEQEALRITMEMLEGGKDPLKVLELCKDAMAAVGEKFEKREYFLSELVFAAEVLKKIMELTLPKLEKEEVRRVGTIVLGTVQGDVHDIGKNIFKVLAEASGFELIDLGIDVPCERFVEAVRTRNPDIVGMSGLVTASVGSMKKTIDALKDAGLRHGVKVIIGGGRADESVKQYSGADAWADDAAKGVRLCKELIGIKE
ncbi:MAG: cobalamin-dependent protein [Bacillota bacterium]|nr:cobalamin-dependent protein [Bacillota bacterium]